MWDRKLKGVSVIGAACILQVTNKVQTIVEFVEMAAIYFIAYTYINYIIDSISCLIALDFCYNLGRICCHF